MPANEFNNFTEHDVGIGLRVPHYHHILTRKPVVDWFEIISENFMIDGRRPLPVLDPDSRAIPRCPARRLHVFRLCGKGRPRCSGLVSSARKSNCIETRIEWFEKMTKYE
jgi:Protein of unknown function (DUF692)